MKERGLICSGESVLGILGDRKTNTRRVIKPQPDFVGGRGEERDPTKYGWADENGAWSLLNLNARLYPGKAHTTNGEEYASVCPHGQPGDRLYVREAFRFPQNLDRHSPAEAARRSLEGYPEPWCPTEFQVDGATANADVMREGTTWGGWGRPRSPWHMPRWASRIDLEIVAVRAEQLNEISTEDILAEGVEVPDVDYSVADDPRVLDCERHIYALNSFRQLWDGLNATRGFGWTANPWVWRIEFRRIQP